MADLNSNDRILARLSELAERNDPINPDLYAKYDVKRGLRNANGTGVLVGLTRIADVVGYEVGPSGEKIPVPGRLMYRGYDVVDLIKDAEKNDDYCFEQCAYLLLFAELPTKSELEEFRKFLGQCRVLPANFTEDMIMKAPSQDIMNKLARGVLASYSYDNDAENRSIANNLRQCIELIARFSTLAAYGYQARRRYYENKSMYIHNPNPALSTAENFLHLIRPDGQYTMLEAQILDLALILHAEHGGGNNSSLTVHIVSSADTDTYSAIAAAIGSLKGRRHGGANIRVVEMMDDIKANVKQKRFAHISIRLPLRKLLTAQEKSTEWDMPFIQSATLVHFSCATRLNSLQKKRECLTNSIFIILLNVLLRRFLWKFTIRTSVSAQTLTFILVLCTQCSIFHANCLLLFSQ